MRGGAIQDRVAEVAIVPDGRTSSRFREFVKQLYDEEQCGVAKWDGYTMYLKPLLQSVSKVPGVSCTDMLMGVVTVPRGTAPTPAPAPVPAAATAYHLPDPRKASAARGALIPNVSPSASGGSGGGAAAQSSG